MITIAANVVNVVNVLNAMNVSNQKSVVMIHVVAKEGIEVRLALQVLPELLVQPALLVLLA